MIWFHFSPHLYALQNDPKVVVPDRLSLLSLFRTPQPNQKQRPASILIEIFFAIPGDIHEDGEYLHLHQCHKPIDTGIQTLLDSLSG